MSLVGHMTINARKTVNDTTAHHVDDIDEEPHCISAGNKGYDHQSTGSPVQS